MLLKAAFTHAINTCVLRTATHILRFRKIKSEKNANFTFQTGFICSSSVSIQNDSDLRKVQGTQAVLLKKETVSSYVH